MTIMKMNNFLGVDESSLYYYKNKDIEGKAECRSKIKHDYNVLIRAGKDPERTIDLLCSKWLCDKSVVMQAINEAVHKGATLSACGKYRYTLSRTWDYSKNKALFIMLNPSTADADDDDPTIRRCMSFARLWGYGGIKVGNLSAYRATDPRELKTVQFDGHHNDQNAQSILKMYWTCKIAVFAWGNPPVELPLCPVYGFEATFFLRATKLGNPGHPLYLKSDVQPIKYDFNF